MSFYPAINCPTKRATALAGLEVGQKTSRQLNKYGFNGSALIRIVQWQLFFLLLACLYFSQQPVGRLLPEFNHTHELCPVAKSSALLGPYTQKLSTCNTSVFRAVAASEIAGPSLPVLPSRGAGTAWYPSATGIKLAPLSRPPPVDATV